jgi:chromosome partitioning protein
MLSEQKLLDALPAEEVKLGRLVVELGVSVDIVLDAALRLQRKGCVRVRKPFLREHRILKLKAKYEEGTRVFAVINLKGGVGKTITSLNLAACLADLGHKTLLVDLDPQANATSALNVKGKTTVYSLLVGTKQPQKAAHKTHFENLYIIPSELNLAGAEVEIIGIDAAYRLWEALEWLKDDYKYIIIDCPPSLSMLSINALAAADSMIVPVQCEEFAVESLDKLVETMTLMKKVNEDIHIRGILLTMYDSRNEHSVETASKVREKYGDLMFKTVIGRDSVFGEAAGKGIPLVHYRRGSDAAKAYVKLAEEVISGGR